MAFKISPQAERILAEITWNARAPIEEIARKLRMRAHTVRRIVRNLEEALHFKPVCWTHPYLLGEIPFRTFFRLKGGSPQRVREFVSFMKSSPQVSWFVSLIGQFQYSVTVRADGHLALLEFFEVVDKKFGDMIVDKSVSTVVNLTCYSPALSRHASGPRAQLEYSAVPDRVELSDLDRKIVEFLRDKPLASLPEVGRVLGVSSTTIAYRFNRLVTTQAILGFGYAYDAVNLQDNEFLVSIATRGFGSPCFDLLANLCAEDGRVWWLGRFIGHWDIQLSLSVKKAHDLDLFVQQMHAICRDQIEEINIHTLGNLYRDR